MASNRETMVIVGAGHAGGRAALGLREAGWAGPVVLIGDEPDAPYERPPLSKGVLLGEPFMATLAPPSRYAEADIEWLPGRRVGAIDRETRTVMLDDGRRISYGALLLATGGRARRLDDVPGAGLDGICTLRTLADAHTLAARLVPGARIVVIGGGFIGLEVAASARSRGCEVVLIEAAPRLLGRAVPAPIATQVQALHEAHGVEVRLGAAPLAFEPAGSGLRVRLADGSALEADTIVVGIGIVPNVELAESAGLVIGNGNGNGIVVDATLRTADPSIFAAGDVALFPSPLSGRTLRLESWHNAEDQARVAAVNMAGGSATVGATPWFWSDQYDHQLQIAGDPSLGERLATRELGAGAQVQFHFDAGGRIVGVAGFGPTAALAKEFKLARMLFERGVRADAATLADPATPLKPLLAAARAGA
jgi:3-phenylpropionate/trans-cinnamate dioxygenase ferredoxin reductase component